MLSHPIPPHPNPTGDVASTMRAGSTMSLHPTPTPRGNICDRRAGKRTFGSVYIGPSNLRANPNPRGNLRDRRTGKRTFCSVYSGRNTVARASLRPTGAKNKSKTSREEWDQLALHNHGRVHCLTPPQFEESKQEFTQTFLAMHNLLARLLRLPKEAKWSGSWFMLSCGNLWSWSIQLVQVDSNVIGNLQNTVEGTSLIIAGSVRKGLKSNKSQKKLQFFEMILERLERPLSFGQRPQLPSAFILQTASIFTEILAFIRLILMLRVIPIFQIPSHLLTIWTHPCRISLNMTVGPSLAHSGNGSLLSEPVDHMTLCEIVSSNVTWHLLLITWR